MIQVDNLVKYYKDFKAVDNISFNIDKSEIVGLLGPNGAGKTTTIRTLCGYLAPTSGEIKINGSSIQENLLMAKKSIGYLPESAPLYGDMLVYDYLLLIANLRQVKNKQERIEEMLELCGLKKVVAKNISELSKGYKQRVGLAHALIGDPEILILDEPTSGLDPNQIIEIRELIKKIGKTKTIVLSSHILSEVEVTCDRIIIINSGKIVADAKTDELKSMTSGAKVVVVEFKNDLKEQVEGFVQKLKGNPAVSDVEEEREQTVKLKITYKDKEDIRGEIFDLLKNTELQIINFYQEDETLESVFRMLTSNALANDEASQENAAKEDDVEEDDAKKGDAKEDDSKEENKQTSGERLEGEAKEKQEEGESK